MRPTTHCVKCNALIYEDEQIDGRGIRCGCLKKYVMKLKKKIKKIEQSKMF